MKNVPYNIKITGDEMRNFRRELQLTQSQFADLIGDTQAVISKLENERLEADPYKAMLTLCLCIGFAVQPFMEKLKQLQEEGGFNE